MIASSVKSELPEPSLVPFSTFSRSFSPFCSAPVSEHHCLKCKSGFSRCFVCVCVCVYVHGNCTFTCVTVTVCLNLKNLIIIYKLPVLGTESEVIVNVHISVICMW